MIVIYWEFRRLRAWIHRTLWLMFQIWCSMYDMTGRGPYPLHFTATGWSIETQYKFNWIVSYHLTNCTRLSTHSIKCCRYSFDSIEQNFLNHLSVMNPNSDWIRGVTNNLLNVVMWMDGLFECGESVRVNSMRMLVHPLLVAVRTRWKTMFAVQHGWTFHRSYWCVFASLIGLVCLCVSERIRLVNLVSDFGADFSGGEFNGWIYGRYLSAAVWLFWLIDKQNWRFSF